MKILNPIFHGMRNDEHCQFGGEFGDLVDRSDPEDLKIVPLFDTWKGCFQVEIDALKKINKSARTPEIAEADRRRGRTFRGIADINRGMINHFDPSMAAAAREIQIVFTTYGNISAKSLTEKTSAYANFIDELRTENNAPIVETLGLEPWVNELESNNGDVAALIKQRDDENASRSNVVMKDARTAVDTAYEALMKRISAGLEFEGSQCEKRREVYEQFIRRHNAIAERHNNAITARRKRGGGNYGNSTPKGDEE